MLLIMDLGKTAILKLAVRRITAIVQQQEPVMRHATQPELLKERARIVMDAVMEMSLARMAVMVLPALVYLFAPLMEPLVIRTMAVAESVKFATIVVYHHMKTAANAVEHPAHKHAQAI